MTLLLLYRDLVERENRRETPERVVNLQEGTLILLSIEIQGHVALRMALPAHFPPRMSALN
ncbi:hypothetical protein VTN02DRAFT_812 [Thermoascus thermophilus]